MDPVQEYAVECRGVAKSYGSADSAIRALRGIDLTVRCGELLMIVGPSGCGKTTLLSVIAGILDQDDGECQVFGRSWRSMSSREKTRYRGSKVGFVFQVYSLLPTLTALENVAVPLLIGGMPLDVALGRAQRMLEKVCVEDRGAALPSQLSGGQQQRVAIARALVHDPKVIVCDEPTAALDQDNGRQIMNTLRSLATNHDRALIVVTHDSRIFHYADRIATMNDGSIQEVSDSRNLLTH